MGLIGVSRPLYSSVFLAWAPHPLVSAVIRSAGRNRSLRRRYQRGTRNRRRQRVRINSGQIDVGKGEVGAKEKKLST